jgi:hypothetical protein
MIEDGDKKKAGRKKDGQQPSELSSDGESKGKLKKKKSNNKDQMKITVVDNKSEEASTPGREIAVPNEDLSFRNLSVQVKGIHRFYAYFNAPIIKFLNHLVSGEIILI